MEYQNTNISDLILPTTITLDTNRQSEIITALKDADIKCSAIGSDNSLSITFSVNDIEKLNKILQPFSVNKQIDDIPVTIPKTKKAENLLPFFNAVSNLFDRKLNSSDRKITAHKEHITVLQKSVSDTRSSINRLTSQNDMLKGVTNIFGFLKNPINALVKRNEKKIERLQKRTIPKLEQQIQIHQNTLDKLNQRIERHKLRKSLCLDISNAIKSFRTPDKILRSAAYTSAMTSLNKDIIELNNERISSYKEQIKADPSKEEKLTPKIEKLTAKNKVLQAAIVEPNGKPNNIESSIVNSESILLTENYNMLDAVDSMAITASVSLSDKAAKVKIEVLDPIMDKDGDNVPDRIDTNFEPEVNRYYEEVDKKASLKEEDEKPIIKVVNAAELKAIKDEGVDFKVNLKMKKDNCVPIMFDKKDAQRVNEAIAALSVNNKRKAVRK